MFSLPASDLVWDPSRQSLYVAVTAASTVNPGTVSVLDTTRARIVAQSSFGSAPFRMALTTDNQYLYVGLSTGGTVHRLSLPTLQSNLSFTLENGSSNQPYYAMQIAPLPGNARAVAIVQGESSAPTKGVGGVAIYDDTTRRTNVFRAQHVVDAIAWSQDGTTLYGTNVESTSFDFYKIAVGPDGASLSFKTSLGFNQSAIYLNLVNDLLYANGGEVMDPEQVKPVGMYHGPNGLLVAPDATHPIVFRLFPDYGSSDPDNNYIIQSYSRDRFTPIASIRVSGIDADVNGFPTAFIRTGDRSLAFATARGALFSIEGNFVGSTTPETVAAPTLTTLETGTSTGGASYTLRRMNVPASDIAWDGVRARLHLAIPGTTLFNPNTVTSIDPTTGHFAGSTNAGSDPSVLAISGDHSYLYVGIASASSVQRLRLGDGTFDSEFYLGRDEMFGAFQPKEIAVAPGQPRTAAVVRSRPNGVSPEHDGAAVFDDAVQRPAVGGNLTSVVVPGGNVGYLNGWLTDSITWGADSSALYGTDNETSSGQFSIYSVDATGLRYERRAGFSDPSEHLHFLNGRIYSDYGQILDIAGDSLVATLELGFRDHTYRALVAVDADLHKLFYLEITYPFNAQVVVYKVETFDLDTLAAIDSVTYSDLSIEKPRLEVMRFIRWGSDGLAFINREGELYLLSGAFVDGRP
ncbi:MAG TPA: hypothetical protein VFL16_07125 [Steroidobacteraceae bacterium]|nr:hypothetical protein [Steroidobacteraceae bacterium]